LRWQIPAEPDRAAVSRLASALDLPELAAELLVRRGVDTPEAAQGFLAASLADLPDPFSMKGMSAAAERLARAVRGGERIILFGDYDVDGVTSTALMTGVLRELGAASEFYIPNRLEEGYGLNVEAVGKLADRGPGLLVALDCGVTAVAEVEHAVRRGLEVLVVDHHTTPAVLPPALAILNPHQPGCAYPTKFLCAAGVAFNLLLAVRKLLREQGHFADRAEPNLRAWLDLVALATVADVVPLSGANRILVRHGLLELSKGTRPGIRALKSVAGLAEDAPVTAGQVGFRLGPRINAAGRLGAAAHAVELLTTSDAAIASRIAGDLDVQNRERQSIERSMLDEAMALGQAQVDAGERALVLAREGWHAGVVGIVAARVAERLHRPTVVIALHDGTGKGSARSIEGFHLYDAIAQASGHLERFGGHRHAAGVTVKAERLDDFRRALQAHAAQTLTDEDLQPRLRLDAPLELARVDLSLVEAIEKLGPFGAGNPEPVFFGPARARKVRVLANKGAGEPHLKLDLEAGPRGLPAIGFGLGKLEGVAAGPMLAAFQLGIDDYGGARRPQLKLKHVKPA
jgi:single-stranded-DNA-specific exonuclease